ncbi:MAG: hypothetical protein WCM93_01345 [Bacteroidota bacterium]
MVKKILSILAICALLLPLKSGAQVNVKDSSIFATMLYPSFAYQIPGGDMKERFGSSASIGPGFMLKTKNNWLLLAEAGFIFGGDVKNEQTILENISTSEGWVIDGNGTYAEIHMYERGFSGMAGFGKIFSGLGPNPNSGIMLMLKGGYLQHKIRIENPGNAAPQVYGAYKKGYDKLSDGPALSGFVGYMFLGNNRLTSFFAGINFTQAWTRSRRIYDFHDMKKDDAVHMDQLYEFKVGWIIPFYKRASREFYYH